MKTRICLFAAAGLALMLTAACNQTPAAKTDDARAAAEGSSARASEKAAFEAAYTAALEKARASDGPGTPALWTLKDEDTTLHLIGTVHLLKPDVNWRSDAINSALKAAHTLVLEADTTSPKASRDMTQFVSSEGLFQDGRTLGSLLTPAELEALERAAADVDMPVQGLQTFKPWFAATTLTVMSLTKDGYDPAAGVESLLERDAQSAGKSIAYLETIDDQLGRLARLPDDVQVDFLVSTLDSADFEAASLDLLVEEWADGDAAGLAAVTSDPALWGSDAVYVAMLKDRNAEWVPKIEEMLETPGTQLIAVGAAHLGGPDGVVTMLRARGHEVAGP